MTRLESIRSRLQGCDPRLFQIAALGLLLAVGACLRDFTIRPEQSALAFAAALLTQHVGDRLRGSARSGAPSAVITALSLSLLLRADNLWVHPLAAAVAIGAKFVVRFRGKHLFNPGNLGVIFALIVLPGAWVSPGQWGDDFALAGWFVALGGLVTHRAGRSDVSVAFLGFHLGASLARVLWLGQRTAVWLHQLQSGALLLFAFFMISDPMTIPNRTRGRVAHAALVAAIAYVWQFTLYRPNALLWALFLAAPAVPLWDLLWPAAKYEWDSVRPGARGPLLDHAETVKLEDPMRRLLIRSLLLPATLLAWLAGLVAPSDAGAFCGFYVGKADSTLYNEASQVVLARNGERTVISMMNDYKGELTEFALVVPVPVVLEKGQIHIGDREVFKHLDAYSAPRLVEYFDPDPCHVVLYDRMQAPAAAGMPVRKSARMERDHALGVTVEAEYTVGEYDIVILSAKQSDGLETWLGENGYRIPKGASAALRPYIQQDMKFFVAKVNLKEQQKTGVSYLRPLQFAFESPKFMLPIRLGMVNAKGPQELILYVLTKNGRVESTNYRTVKLPSGMDIPEYVKGDFANFYKAMFDTQVEQAKMRAVFTEYFWDMGWCDPCAADPLSRDELKKLGVFWLDEGSRGPGGGIMPMPRRPMPGGAVPVMVTRLHVRYTPESFPEDLVLQETADRENFQGRYVLRHAWNGQPGECSAAESYFEDLAKRRETEATTLASLTGWPIGEIRRKMDLGAAPKRDKWWEKLWD